jgi:hypothetical protein
MSGLRLRTAGARCAAQLREGARPAPDAGTLIIDFAEQPGRVDSGQLDGDLSGLFVELGETARDAGTGVLLTIGEIQYLGKSELAALIVGLHRVSQLALPVLVCHHFRGWQARRGPTQRGCSHTSTSTHSGETTKSGRFGQQKGPPRVLRRGPLTC